MIVQRWRALGPAAKALVGTVVLVVGLNLLLAGVATVTGGSGPGGPTSSSYATGGDGMAAWAELLGRHGHHVERLREPFDRAGLDPRSTVVLADPRGVSAAEVPALAVFVERGGRLVAGGAAVAPVLAGLPGGGPMWGEGEVGTARPLVPVPEVAGVTAVVGAGDGSWHDAGGTLPVLAGDDGVLTTVASVGSGRVVAVADASVLQNRRLAQADNAAFALAVVGEAGRPVSFAEYQHGYGRPTGVRAVPARWRWALAGSLLAALAWMWSRGRRLGPPDLVEHVGPPPRRAYVDAVAATLARTRQPGVAALPLQARARHGLARRAGLPADAGDDELRQAAAGLALPAEEVGALFRPVRGDDDLVAVGRLLARLGEGPR